MYYIGVDIGGTCLSTRTATITRRRLCPRRTIPSGVMTGLGRLAEAEGLDLSTLLARTSRFGHGTTISTNAALERAGACRVPEVCMPCELHRHPGPGRTAS
jgi:N-methylhydantoinase A